MFKDFLSVKKFTLHCNERDYNCRLDKEVQHEGPHEQETSSGLTHVSLGEVKVNLYKRQLHIARISFTYIISSQNLYYFQNEE
jgi:hypothetical protein